MKKTIYTLGMIGVISGAAYAADNYTCATPPSCASLGYTLTSTADCIGTPLKCPFDTSKYFCTTKTEALSVVMPNYAQVKNLSTNTKYTVGTGILSGYDCGWVMMSAADETASTFFVNDIAFGDQYSWNSADLNDWWNDGNSIFVPLVKGNTFQLKYRLGKNTGKVSFFPCQS